MIPHDIIELNRDNYSKLEGLLFSTFLKSFKKACGSIASKDLYYSTMHTLLESLIQDANNKCLLAVYSRDPDEILGWALAQPSTSTIHYVYTKQPYRGHGIASILVRELIPDVKLIKVSLITRAGLGLIEAMQKDGTQPIRASDPPRVHQAI